VDPSKLRAADLPEDFGRYRLLGVLGEGGMARVFRAELQGPAGFRRQVALKVLKRQTGGVDDLVREARLGALLRHPNLVDVYELDAVDGHLYVAMALVEGTTLKALLKAHGALPSRAVVELAEQLAAALDCVHSLAVAGVPTGLVHRDLKPANVLLDQNGRVRVADFGVAWTAEMAGKDRDTVRGTPAYMSPEQATGEDIDGRSDLFALGALLAEAALGERLFRGKSPQAILRGVVQVEERLRDGLADHVDRAVPGLGEIVFRCLRERAADRPASANAVMALLRGLRGEGDGLARVLRDAPEPQVRDGLDPTTVSSAVSVARADTNVVVPPSAFIGRRDALASLGQCLAADERLVTVTGPGGVGKTRLSLEHAHRTLAQWVVHGGAWFVDLSEARSVAGILRALAEVLGVPLIGHHTVADLVDWLGRILAARGPTLLVLDNFEQLVDLAPMTLARWLDAAPELRVLVTSRERLHLVGERVLTLAPLAPAEAAAMFEDRAGKRVADRGLLLELVTRLDCLPLAVDLAAARAGEVPLPALLEAVGDSLDQTLTWSWELLAPWEQAALAQCSVFRGGFTVDQAEAVLDLSAWPERAWALPILEALFDKSLLMSWRPAQTPDVPRFGLLETVRAFAQAQLGPGRAARRRHAQVLARLGTQDAIDLLDQHGGLARRQELELELDNLLAAVDFALDDGAGDTACRAALAAMRVLETRGPLVDALDLAGRVRAGPELSPAVWLQLINGEARVFFRSGQSSEALGPTRQGMEAARAAGDAFQEGRLTVRLASLLMRCGELDEARSAFHAGLTLAREQGDEISEAWALANLGSLCMFRGDYIKARNRYQQALTLQKRIGDRRSEGSVLGNLGLVHLRLEELQQAAAMLKKSLRVLEAEGETRVAALIGGNLGLALRQMGRTREARDRTLEAISRARALGATDIAAAFSASLAELLADLGDGPAAMEALAGAEAVHVAAGDRLELARTLIIGARIAHQLGEMGERDERVARAGVLLADLGLGAESDLGRELAGVGAE